MANSAAVIPSPKAPLEVQSAPLYTPGTNELLVKNEIIAFNAIEFKIAKLGAIPLDYPAILGSTFGGTIEATGPGVTEFKVGDRVAVSKRFGVKGNQYGAYQRYVVVGDKMVSKIPAELDLSVPASLMMNLTCVVGLFTGKLGLEKPSLEGRAPARGQKILVFGGSSSFGGLSVRYLSQAGYAVVTTSSARNHAFVASLGAAVVVDHTLDSDTLSEKLVAEGPYDVVVDTVSLPDTIPIAARVLAAQGGKELYAMQPSFVPETLPDGVERKFEPWSDCLYEHANRKLQEWVVQTYLPQGLVSGSVTPLPIETISGGLGAVNEALTRLQNGVSGLRLAVNPWE